MGAKNKAVNLTVEDGVATVRIEREHGNAIDDLLIAGLTTAFHELGDDSAVQGVLLTAGGKMFSPGLDLQELLPLDRPAMEHFMERFDACVLQLYTFPKPVVAALQGHALAGGFILALTADWRIARSGAMVGLNEIKVGVPLPFGVSQVLRSAVPAHRLEEVALLGRNYAGHEALAAGLVNEVVSPEEFEGAAKSRIREFVSRDLQALATTKRYLRSGIVERIRAYGPTLTAEFLDAWFSPGTQGRIRAIVDGLASRGKA